MTTLVSIENESGWLRRYECGGESIRLTHSCATGFRANMRPELVENFRIHPPADFAVQRLCDPPKRSVDEPSIGDPDLTPCA